MEYMEMFYSFGNLSVRAGEWVRNDQLYVSLQINIRLFCDFVILKIELQFYILLFIKHWFYGAESFGIV